MPFTPNPNLNPQNKADEPISEPVELEPDLTPEQVAHEAEISPVPEGAIDSESAESKPEETVQDPESTIGTGTSMALGCVAGTVVLIGFGLLFLFISTLV